MAAWACAMGICILLELERNAIPADFSSKSEIYSTYFKVFLNFSVYKYYLNILLYLYFNLLDIAFIYILFYLQTIYTSRP